MSWIISLIIGGIVGWLARIITKTNAQEGLIANVLVGVAGSILGTGVAVLCGCGSAPPIDAGSASAGGTALRLDTTPGGRGPAMYMLF